MTTRTISRLLKNTHAAQYGVENRLPFSITEGLMYWRVHCAFSRRLPILSGTARTRLRLFQPSARKRGRGLPAVLTLAFAALLPIGAFAQADVSILYHEPLVLLEMDTRASGSTARMVFDAFGRRFVVLVDESAPGIGDPTVELIKAHLADAPGSWARLTLRDDAISGLITAPDDVYVIEPRSVIAGTLILEAAGDDSTNIIYRLADTLVAPGLLSCDIQHDGEHIDGKTAFAGLTAELGGTAQLQATDGNLATIGVIADSRLFGNLGVDTQAAVEQMMLTVGGIYEQQVGLAVEPASIFVSTAAAQDPVSDVQNGSDLLNELAQWRLANQTDVAITHLITDRRIMSNSGNLIAGISFLGSPGRSGVCDGRTGASISEWLGNALTALVIAHELGHNFGAPHDGQTPAPDEPPNPCAGQPNDVYLMSPLLRSSRMNQFSQCSIEQMNTVIAAATCLRPAPPAAPTQVAPGATGNSAGGGGGGGALHGSAVLLLAWLARTRRRTTIRA